MHIFTMHRYGYPLRPMMTYGWEGKRRSGIAVAIRHKLEVIYKGVDLTVLLGGGIKENWGSVDPSGPGAEPQ